jgi:hypothetical protein
MALLHSEIYISDNSAADFWERLFDDERRGQPQWSLTVEPETLFEVLKGGSEGGNNHLENSVQHLESISGSPPILRCVT